MGAPWAHPPQLPAETLCPCDTSDGCWLYPKSSCIGRRATLRTPQGRGPCDPLTLRSLLQPLRVLGVKVHTGATKQQILLDLTLR